MFVLLLCGYSLISTDIEPQPMDHQVLFAELKRWSDETDLHRGGYFLPYSRCIALIQTSVWHPPLDQLVKDEKTLVFQRLNLSKDIREILEMVKLSEHPIRPAGLVKHTYKRLRSLLLRNARFFRERGAVEVAQRIVRLMSASWYFRKNFGRRELNAISASPPANELPYPLKILASQKRLVSPLGHLST